MFKLEVFVLQGVFTQICSGFCLAPHHVTHCELGPMLWFLKIFLPKNSAKKLAFLSQNKAKF
jgi:hypothetical protein